ncbi:hypothetical protein CTI14_16210 [Methylobacterium radiotolerans]|nr:hypothetical protein CTI14_16210 [Methylobacterium radiotolerans]
MDGVRSRQDHDAISSTFGAPGRRLRRVTVEAMSTGEPRHVAVPGIAPREPFVGNRGVRALAVATDPHGKVQYGKVQYGQDSRPGDHARHRAAGRGFPTRTWPRRAGTGDLPVRRP